jgi:hypothetical protein
MALPGFTAEASVGPTIQVYKVQDRYGPAPAAHLHPQSNGEEWDAGPGDEEDLGSDLGDEDGMEMAAEDDAEVEEEV